MELYLMSLVCSAMMIVIYYHYKKLINAYTDKVELLEAASLFSLKVIETQFEIINTYDGLTRELRGCAGESIGIADGALREIEKLREKLKNIPDDDEDEK